MFFNIISFYRTSSTQQKLKSKSTKYWLVLSPKHWAKLSTLILALSTTTTTTTTPPPAPHSTVRLPSWSALLVEYEKGDKVIYNGIKYRCVTPHRSYAGAEPSLLTWALWQRIV